MRKASNVSYTTVNRSGFGTAFRCKCVCHLLNLTSPSTLCFWKLCSFSFAFLSITLFLCNVLHLQFCSLCSSKRQIIHKLVWKNDYFMSLCCFHCTEPNLVRRWLFKLLWCPLISFSHLTACFLFSFSLSEASSSLNFYALWKLATDQIKCHIPYAIPWLFIPLCARLQCMFSFTTS